MANINNDDFQKSLERLETMAKGQLYHTPSDSSVGGSGWGSSESDQDEWDTGIDENGTDYNGMSYKSVREHLAEKVSKSFALSPAEVAIAKGENPLPLIGQKMAKGEAITPAETWAVTNSFQGLKKGKAKPGAAGTPGEQDDANSVPCTNAAENQDDEMEADAKKSLSSSAGLQKGLEVSGFLAEFTRAFGEALTGVEQRLGKSIASSVAQLSSRVDGLEGNLAKSHADTDTFNKALAEAVVGIGAQVAGNTDVAVAQAHQPVGAPKSQLRSIQGGQDVQVVAKSFGGPGGLNMDLNKAQITNIMTDMVQKGELGSLEVIKYETSGELLPEVQQKIFSYASGSNR